MSDFPVLGISFHGIENFIQEVGGLDAVINLTTTDVCEKYIKPLTKASNKSYCEFSVIDRKDAVHFQPANVFISHAWKYNFLDVVDAMRKIKDQSEGDPIVYYWFDLFTNNQNIQAEPPPFEWWCMTFKQAIQRIGRVAVVITPWEDPIPLQRSWCLFEVYTAVVAKSQFEVIMSTNERNRFESMIAIKSTAFHDMLGNIDLRKSQATNPLDRDRIFEVVEKAVTFRRLNMIVTEKFREWILSTAKNSCELSSLPVQIPDIEQGDSPTFLDGVEPHEVLILRKKLLYADLLALNGRYAEFSTVIEQCHENYQHLQKNQGDKYAFLLTQQKVLFAEGNSLSHPRDKTFLKVVPLVVTAYSDALNHLTNAITDATSTDETNRLLPWYLRALIGRSRFYLSINQLTINQAKKLHELLVKHLGEESVEAIKALEILASAHSLHYQPEIALQYYENIHDKYSKFFKDSHPMILRLLYEMSIVYSITSRYDKALATIKLCYELSLEKFDHQDPFLLQVYQQYLILLICMGYFLTSCRLFLSFQLIHSLNAEKLFEFYQQITAPSSSSSSPSTSSSKFQFSAATYRRIFFWILLCFFFIFSLTLFALYISLLLLLVVMIYGIIALILWTRTLLKRFLFYIVPILCVYSPAFASNMLIHFAYFDRREMVLSSLISLCARLVSFITICFLPVSFAILFVTMLLIIVGFVFLSCGECCWKSAFPTTNNQRIENEAAIIKA